MLDEKPLIVVGIPAYNEERTIAKVVLQARKHADVVVVCDDGSSDMTGEIAETLGAVVVRHEGNLGYGAAIQALFKMAKKLERYELAWLEEPLMPDDIDGLVELRRKVDVPIATGEHEYTRWGTRELLTRGAVDVLQLDVTWGGGITEMKKVCALASAEGVPVIPHAGWSEPAQCITFSEPKQVCPMIEYLVKWAVIQQAFNKRKLTPEKGCFHPPSKIGLGFEPQMDKLVEEES